MKYELSKVAQDSLDFMKKMKQLRKVKAAPIKLDEIPALVRQPAAMKFVFCTDDYLIWAKQMADLAKGILVPPTQSSWANFRKGLKDAAEYVHPRWTQTENKITEEYLEDTTYMDDFGRKMPAVELIQRESIQPLNADVPDDLYLYEMGCGNRKNESLDYREMDDRDMRERGVVVNNKVYALYEKRKPDIAPRSDLRQEVLSKMLSDQVDYADVDSLAHMFRDMRLSRTAVLKLIHGYVRPDEEGKLSKSAGLKSLDSEDLEYIANDFENMKNELSEFDIPEPETNAPRTLEDERIYWFGVAQKLWDRGHFDTDVEAFIDFVETRAKDDWGNGYYQDPDHVDDYVIYQNEECLTDSYDTPDEEADEEWDPIDESTAMALDANAFSSHPLFDDSSCINDETINEIKTASWSGLSDIKSWLMGNDAWYLNSDQRKIAWSFIKGRENELIEIAMKRPIAQMVGSYVTESKDSGRACAMLFAWKNGDRFDTDDSIFKFDEEGSFENELVAAWTIFRREHKEHQRTRKITKKRNEYLYNSYRDRLPKEKGPKRVAVKRDVPLTLESLT